MSQFGPGLSVLALLGLLAGPPAWAGKEAPSGPGLGVEVEDFSYRDTSGEVIDQTAAHQKRLDAFVRALREDVAAQPHDRPVSSGDARIKVVGGVQKMSTLIQWAKVAVVDTVANRVLFDKLYTFRGDTDEAWDRARGFVSRDILAVLAAAEPAAAPIGLAVFDFELEDTSAATPEAGREASDAAYLADVTNGVRQLLAQSGRYRLVDPGSTDLDAAKRHTLRDCNGCDAAIAQKLGAEQSLVGVVRRVSRTEYTVGFQVRDASSGAVISRGDSGLRMGADYSWTRGAVHLVGDRLLAREAHQ
ncbi:DUF2380 domain-containing protein [Bradyrhizobium genosp. L]|uniref:DUF3280 domain-containing protein n=1 Tax=Bradyrhizobium genosp. L TaxID=83637 RepID=UPI0018A24E57|nr:DUF3280 domain-containing protein [Bradyrhizobium genosp. L]QPF82003.1 DUF2380 domain-containing protein [Bradyrhizobium genosp. L]